MKSKKFSELDYAPIVGMIQCPTAAECITKIKYSIAEGAEALGVQLCRLKKEERTPEKLTAVFDACEGKPIYVTSYRVGQSEGMTDEECCALLKLAAKCGATLCDVIGDCFDATPTQMTRQPTALQKQKELIDELHALGAEVLISTHDMRELSEDEIFTVAALQAQHGADVIKIVVRAESFDRLPEYIRVMQRVKTEIGKPFLFLDALACAPLLRRVGPDMGSCMYLCVAEHGPLDTPQQPLIRDVKTIRRLLQSK